MKYQTGVPNYNHNYPSEKDSSHSKIMKISRNKRSKNNKLKIIFFSIYIYKSKADLMGLKF